MYKENDLPRPDHVALLAEGVDRNILPSCQFWGHLVALLAEGVDRNGNTVNSH